MFNIYADGELLFSPLDSTRIITSPKAIVEMGKAGSVSFNLPPTNRLYSSIKPFKTVITVEYDEIEIFRGRIFSARKNFNNFKMVYCEGNLSYLVDSRQKIEAYTGTTHALFTKVVNAHNARVEASKRFIVGNITVENRSIIIAGQSDDIEDAETQNFNYKQIAINASTSEWPTTYDFINTYFIGYIGGYLRTRRVGNNTYLDYLKDYGSASTQNIEFGVNLLDLTEEEPSEDTFSILIPLGDNNLTISSVNGGSDELVDASAVAAYGRIFQTHHFANVTNPSTLLENGKRYLSSHVNRPQTITVKAIDLHLLNPNISAIYLGDVVRTKSDPHGLNSGRPCSKIEYDLENPANNLYTFGVPKQTLTERYKKDKNESERNAINRTGSSGRAGAAAAEEAKGDLDKFYDAWISVDKESAHINLGAVYKELKNATEVLVNQVGIDLNAVTGNINLKSLRAEVDEEKNKLRDQAAQIDILTSDTQSKIELLTSYVDYVGDVETKHYAEIILKADKLESSIALKADKITLDANVTEINTTINGIKSNIASFSSSITKINSDITAVKKLIADEISALKADVSWLNSFWITVASLTASGSVSAARMYIGGASVATQTWVESKGYLTDNGVSWGSVGTGLVWLTVDGSAKNMAMANHTHSNYLTGLPSHRHSFSGTYSLAWGHTHTNSGAGGVSNYSAKTITISGNTGYYP